MGSEKMQPRLKVRTVGIGDIRDALPVISRLEESRPNEFDLLILALGFEDRLTLMMDKLAKAGITAGRGLLLEYRNNRSENELQRAPVLSALRDLGVEEIESILFDGDLEKSLSRILTSIGDTNHAGRILFDITAASNPLIVHVLRLLLDSDFSVCLSYGEAASYHPTKAEYLAQAGGDISALSTANGTQELEVTISDFAEQDDSLRDLVVIIPGFDHDRAKKIIAHVDSSLLLADRDSIVWILGNPHRDDDTWRVDLMRELHNLDEVRDSDRVQLASTFDYVSIWSVLDDIYEEYAPTCRITISPMGSKLQAVGVSLFCLDRPDVKVVFATPKEYRTTQYTTGLRDAWLLPLGETRELRARVQSVGEIVVDNGVDVILSGTRRADWLG